MKSFNDPKAILAETGLIDRFVTFVKIDTQSDEKSETTPSTAKQFDLQKVLVGKLEELGCKDIDLNDKGYLYATFPGNVENAKTIGLIAHVDTSPDYSGKDVTPIFHENYDGGPIVLPKGDITIETEDNPALAPCKGDTIITASGDTLLGADDKAGIAIIMAALEVLGKNPDIKHPPLRVAFTPDEEVGRGASNFDVEGFNAHCAYTLDGSLEGEVNFETFSADKAEVTFTGVAVHPGFAKGKMVNALRYAGAFLDALPKNDSPEMTEEREGFIHPTSVAGNSAVATVEMILRDFELDKLKGWGDTVKAVADKIAQSEPRLKVDVEIKEQYRNMADTLQDFPQVRDNLMEAAKDAGLDPQIIPIRGGTDGSGLTAMGLPTPNIFTGGMNFHGPREWISTRVMGLAVCVVLNLAQRWAE